MLIALNSSTAPHSLATVSGDNRLKVWNTHNGELRHQYVEPSHLQSDYTCIAFVTTAKSTSALSAVGLIALGNAIGHIIVWNLQTGEVLCKLGDSGNGHSRRVNDVCFDRTGALLYSCGEDGLVIEWNVRSQQCNWAKRLGGALNAVITRICLSSDGTSLLCAASTMFLYALGETQPRLLKTFTGHPQPVTQLCFTPDAKFAFSGSRDRFLSVWDMQADIPDSRKRSKKSKKQDDSSETMASPIWTVATEGAPRHLSATATSDAGYYLVCVSLSGILGVWSWSPSSTGSNTLTTTPGSALAQISLAPQFTLRGLTTSLSHKPHGAHAENKFQTAQFQGRRADSKKDDTDLETGQVIFGAALSAGAALASPALLVVRYSALRPVVTEEPFLAAPARQDDSDSPRALFLPAASLPALTQVFLSHSQTKNQRERAAEAIAPLVSDTLMHTAPKRKRDDHVAANAIIPASSDPFSASEQLAGSGLLKRSKLDEGQTLSDLLAQLPTDVDAAKGDKAEKEQAGAAASGSPTPGDNSLRHGVGSAAIASGSLVAVLSQALQAQDHNLLEYCLTTGSAGNRVVTQTVARLDSKYVLPLLEALTQRLRQRPGRGRQLLPWLQTLLSTHTGLLMAHRGTLGCAAELRHCLGRRGVCARRWETRR
jgi:hypothetical protein